MTVTGTAFAERKPAGRALMQEVLTLVQLQHEKETVIASIGGFDLVFAGERLGRDGYHYTTLLRRTGAEFEIELPVTVTPLGAIARLEHALSNSRASRSAYRHRLADARKRLATYGARVGEAIRRSPPSSARSAGACRARNGSLATSEEKRGSGEARPHRGVIEGRKENARSQSGRAGAAGAQPTASRSRPGALARRAVTPCSRLPGRDARRQLRRPARPAGRRGSSERRRRRPAEAAGRNPEQEHPMELIIRRSARAEGEPRQGAPLEVQSRRPTPCCSPRSRRSASSSRP